MGFGGVYGIGALWFWAAALLLWRGLCGATLGVPNDVLLGAARSAEDGAIFERLARRNVARTAQSWRRGGVPTAAMGGFLIAFLAAYAVATGSPLAFDAFALTAPAVAFAAISARASLALDAAAPDGPALRTRFLKLRAIGFAAMLASFTLLAAPRIVTTVLILT